LGVRFFRLFSIYPTALFIKLRLAPNFISLLAITGAITGGVLLIFGSHHCLIIGAVVLMLSFMLDCSDGEVARYTGKLTPYGNYLEGIYTHILFIAILAGLGIGTYRLSGNMMMLWFGISALCFNVLFRQCELRMGWVLELIKERPRYSPLAVNRASPVYKIVLNTIHRLTFSADGMLFLLLLFAIINKTVLLVMFYGAIMPSMFLAYNFFSWFSLRR